MFCHVKRHLERTGRVQFFLHFEQRARSKSLSILSFVISFIGKQLFPPKCAISTVLFGASGSNLEAKMAERTFPAWGGGTKDGLRTGFTEFCNSKRRMSLSASETLAITIYFLVDSRSL